MKRIAIAISILVSFAGCVAGDGKTPSERPGNGNTDHWNTDDGALKGSARFPERLSIDQLYYSFQAVLGETWSVNGADGTAADIFGPYSNLYGALGGPDYFTRLSETLDPHMLLAKFVFEGALVACDRAVTADQRRSASDRKVLSKADPSDTLLAARGRILANVRDMKLRFHGERIDSDDDPRLEPYTALFETASGLPGHGPADGWRAVCVAMVTDPEFVLY